MTPLAVDPQVLSAAGSAVVATGDGLAANLTVLTSGFAANTGQDTAGTVFGLAYQSAAESLLKAAAAAINACRFNGAKIQLSASNYSRAEAASTLGGGAGVLSPPPDPVKIAAPGPPGTLGPGESPPALWAAVQSLVHDLWPDGDVAALHTAAGRWRSFGAAISGMQGALNASKSLIGGQQIPEGAQIGEVLSQIGDNANSIGAQCQKLAATLDDFANGVSQAQNAIRDLLHRLGSFANLAHDAVLIFEGKAFDELKKIAEDINAVLHHLGREARACEQSMNMGMRVIDGLVVGMEKFMRGQFTHFLGQEVGNGVATAFDTWVNTGEGVFKGAFQMAQGIEELDPRWFLLDPEGAAATWAGMTKTGLLNHILNPQDAVEADKQMFRSLLHLDDWRADRPGLGLGENVFDVGTLFLPGVGEAGAGTKGAAAAGRAAEEGGEAADAAGAVGRGGEAAGEFAGASGALGDIGKAGGGLTKDLEGLTGDLPKADLPASGQPVAFPTDKLPDVPVESAPHSVESAPPAPHEPASVPGPQEPASAPADGPVSAPAGDGHEPAPTPGGGAAGPVPGPHAPSAPAPQEPVAPAGGPHEPGSPVVNAPRDPASPGAADPRKPASAPTDAPHEPSSSPAAAGPHDPASAPAAGPREPASAPVGRPHDPLPAVASGAREPSWAHATSEERLPQANPRAAEPVPARAPMSPGGLPAAPGPAAAHPPAPAAASPAPRASAASFAPASGRPAELPTPRGGGPRQPGDSVSGQHQGGSPHSRNPRGSGDGGASDGHWRGLRPHDGKPHGPGDGRGDHGGATGGGEPPAAIDRLTSDDLSAFADYTGSGYIDMNEALRSDALDASQYARIEALNNALGKLPPYEGPVVRGTNLPPEVLAQYRPDEYIIEKGFMSTTRDPFVAQSPAFAGNIELRIVSFTGRDVSGVSMFPAEQEVIFRSHTRFLVIGKKLDPLTGRTIIEMIED